jgi:DNA-binding response OmpR family regulator
VPARRITIVEDDDNVSGLLEFLLKREGFVPEVVRDGRAALEHVRDRPPPAAVVLDQMLPYRDAHAVATAMRADRRWSGVPIVLLRSAPPAGWDPLREDALVDVCLSKPLDPFEVLAHLRMFAREAA